MLLPPLSTPGEYQAMTGDVSSPEETVAAVLTAASAVVRAYCGWHIYPKITEEITVNGSGSTVQGLPTLQVLDVTAVSSNGVVLDMAGIDWAPEGILEWRTSIYYSPGYFVRKRRGVVVDLTHGFVVQPYDVTALVVAIAARALASPDGATREQTGQVSISYSQTSQNTAGGLVLLSHEQDQLRQYRIPREI